MTSSIFNFLIVIVLLMVMLRIVLRAIGIHSGMIASFFVELAAEIAHDIVQGCWSLLFGPPRRRMVRDTRSRCKKKKQQ